MHIGHDRNMAVNKGHHGKLFKLLLGKRVNGQIVCPVFDGGSMAGCVFAGQT